MIDLEARRAERRAAQGHVGGRAQHLLAQLRAGTLERGNVLFLAYLGDDGARELLAADAPPAPDELVPWVHGLRAAGGEALVRASLAAVRLILPPDDPAPPGLRAATAWIRCRCDEHTAALHDAHHALYDPHRSMPEPSAWTFGAALELARAEAGGDSLLRVAEVAAQAVAGVAARLGERGHHAVRAAIRAHLVAWALGELDDEAEPPASTASPPLSPAERARLARHLTASARSVHAWTRKLGGFGKPTCVVAAIAAGRPCLELSSASRDAEPRLTRALDAASAWFGERTHERLVAARAARAEALAVATDGPSQVVAEVAGVAASARAADALTELVSAAQRALRHAGRPPSELREAMAAAVEAAIDAL